MYPYEGMILVDPVMHGADPEGVEATVRGLLEKHGAKIHDFEKWDERKLAYEIKGHKRGVYLLTRLEMPGEGVDEFRRECKITECILRQLMIRLEDDIPGYLERSAAYYEKMKEDQESRRGDSRDSRDRGDRPAPRETRESKESAKEPAKESAEKESEAQAAAE
jgi:small subunit ribosomal protein S6